MNSYAIRTKTDKVKLAVIDEIKRRDPSAELDPEGNPITLWIDTELCTQEVEGIEGVQYCILSNKACSCGSGKPKEALYDARGIFCCYYCEDCEKEKRSRYRADVLEDPDYIADEPIEPEDY
jgi:hypothetical protein